MTQTTPYEKPLVEDYGNLERSRWPAGRSGVKTVPGRPSRQTYPAAVTSASAYSPDHGGKLVMRLKLAVAVGVASAVLAMPATSSAQTDVGALCDSVLGSGTTDLGVASVDRCLAAQPDSTCTLSDTINVLNLVRIRHGICIDITGILANRAATVRGVATVRVLPAKNKAKARRARRAERLAAARAR